MCCPRKKQVVPSSSRESSLELEELSNESGLGSTSYGPHGGGGGCSSLLQPTPAAWAGGVREEGGVLKNFLHFGGIYEIPISF